MNDNDIWYSSTLGYEGAGVGSNTTELFNAIQRLLKLYAPNASTPTMMIGNKQSSFNADTQLTHIEQTFAVKIKESMVTVLETALKSFFADNPLTKDSNTYRIFSQGQVSSVTKPLSYLTQSSAIAEAQREIAGSMATIYNKGGKPYITALGANQAEIDRISQGGFANLIPSARSMQHDYNIEIKRAEAARLAEIDRKQRSKEAADNIKAINSQINTAHKEAEIAAKEEAARVAAENAQLISSTEANIPSSMAAKEAYYRRSHGSRYHAWKRGNILEQQERESAVASELARREQNETDIMLRRSEFYRKNYGEPARAAYYQGQHDIRLARYEDAQLAAHNKRAADAKYVRDLVAASGSYRFIQDYARQVYYQEQHDARQYQYDWRIDALGNALPRAIASEPYEEILSPREQRRRAARMSRGRDLDIEANSKEDLRSAGERHRDNLRVFGKVAGGISLLVGLVSKILGAVSSVYKATATAAVDTAINERTAKALGIDPYTLYKYNALGEEKNLGKGIFTRAFTQMQEMFGNPLAEDNYALYHNNASFMTIAGDAVDKLVAGGFRGESADKYASVILNEYLKRYKSGILLNGNEGTPEQMRVQLINSLKSVSPELAEVFGAAIDEGAGTFEEFLASSRRGQTSYTANDNSMLATAGETVARFRAFFSEEKLNIFSEMAESLTKILNTVEGIVKWLDKDARYDNQISTMKSNSDLLKKVERDRDVADAYLKSIYGANYDVNALMQSSDAETQFMAKQHFVTSKYIDEITSLINSGSTVLHSYSTDFMIDEVSEMLEPVTTSETASAPLIDSLVGSALETKYFSPKNYMIPYNLTEARAKAFPKGVGKDKRKEMITKLRERYNKARNLPPEERRNELQAIAREVYMYGIDLYELSGVSKPKRSDMFSSNIGNAYSYLMFLAEQQYQDPTSAITEDTEGIYGLKATPGKLKDSFYNKFLFGPDEPSMSDLKTWARDKNTVGSIDNSNMNMNLTINLDGKKIGMIEASKDSLSPEIKMFEDLDRSAGYTISLQQS